jgi:hypothetical protein
LAAPSPAATWWRWTGHCQSRCCATCRSAPGAAAAAVCGAAGGAGQAGLHCNHMPGGRRDPGLQQGPCSEKRSTA